MDAIARRYVRLVLALGRHDPLYVDAYYGPPETRAEVAAEAMGLDAIADAAEGAAAEATGDSARARFLRSQLGALAARARIVGGAEMGFDEESRALYGIVAPTRTDADYAEIVEGLEAALPGDGPLGERYDRFRAHFEVPSDRTAAVFSAAIDAARERTRRRIELPEGESFRVEYVTGQVWGAYNWYEGGSRSLIQVNVDSPTTVSGAVRLACHEGYPGHHVYNVLLERDLARGCGWDEFTIYPLYSPQSLVAEGTAEYGVDLAFPEEERRRFEREALLPLAGLDPEGYDAFERVQESVSRLATAGVDAGREYLDGRATREETLDRLARLALATPDRALRRLGFIEAHRSYLVTYGVGEDLVRTYVEGRGGDRWATFEALLREPVAPSDLLPDA